MAVSFTVPGTPVGFARAGGGKSVGRFTPARQRSAMGSVRLFAARAMEGRALLEGPLFLSVEAFYVVPSSWSKPRQREAVWKTSKPDLDNIGKLVEDACNRVVWVDDAQIAAMVLTKKYGEREELRVRVEPVGEGA
jgi:Holliday junction resolvase RusA-like endonuclease